MTDFQKKVYQYVQTIPSGQIRTYQQVAAAIGHPKAYRAVGTALGKNIDPKTIPCHRVVTSNGSMGGYAWGVDKKIKLLQKEGVTFAGNKAVLD